MNVKVIIDKLQPKIIANAYALSVVRLLESRDALLASGDLIFEEADSANDRSSLAIDLGLAQMSPNKILQGLDTASKMFESANDLFIRARKCGNQAENNMDLAEKLNESDWIISTE